MTEFFIIISKISEFWPMLFIVLIASLGLYAYKKRDESFILVFSALLANLFTYVLKVVFEVPRPLDSLVSIDGYRFPSLHATMAGVVFAWMYLFSGSLTRSRFWVVLLRIIGVAWVVLICYARIYLRVHLLTDVLVGALIGVLSVYFIKWFVKQKF